MGELKQFGVPLLIGISRKSFLSIDDDGAEDRLPATLGATLLRVIKDAEDTFIADGRTVVGRSDITPEAD